MSHSKVGFASTSRRKNVKKILSILAALATIVCVSVPMSVSAGCCHCLRQQRARRVWGIRATKQLGTGRGGHLWLRGRPCSAESTQPPWTPVLDT
jgi:hypothetical protein